MQGSAVRAALSISHLRIAPPRPAVPRRADDAEAVVDQIHGEAGDGVLDDVDGLSEGRVEEGEWVVGHAGDVGACV